MRQKTFVEYVGGHYSQRAGKFVLEVSNHADVLADVMLPRGCGRWFGDGAAWCS